MEKNIKLKPKSERPPAFWENDFKFDERRWTKEYVDSRAKIIKTSKKGYVVEVITLDGKDKKTVTVNYGFVEKIFSRLLGMPKDFYIKKKAINMVDFFNLSYDNKSDTKTV